MSKLSKKSPRRPPLKLVSPKGQKKISEFFAKTPPVSKVAQPRIPITNVLDVSTIDVSSDEDFKERRNTSTIQILNRKTKLLKISPKKNEKRKRQQSSPHEKDEIIPPTPGLKKSTLKIFQLSKKPKRKVFTSTPLDPEIAKYPTFIKTADISLAKFEEEETDFINEEDISTPQVELNNSKFENLEAEIIEAPDVKNYSTVAQTSNFSEDSDLVIVEEKILTEDDILDVDWSNLDELEEKEEPETLVLTEWRSCTVLHIFSEKNIKILKLQSTTSTAKATCILKQQWAHFKLEVDNHVNVLAILNSQAKYEINNDYGFIILWPNTLVSGTTLMSSLWCARKTVLGNSYGSFTTSNTIMTYGCLIHELLQETLKRKSFAPIAIKSLTYEIVERNSTILRLFECGLTTEETLKELLLFCDKIAEFVQTYLGPNDSGKFIQRGVKNGNWDGYITKVHDIEENLWCPTFGIKGKVDVSVAIKSNTLKNTINSKQLVVPLELKTGKAVSQAEHVGQVALYNMMLRQLGYNSPSGLLLYLRENKIKEVSVQRREERDLMILRNNLVYYLKQNVKFESKPPETESKGGLEASIMLPELPPVLGNERMCKNCEALTICSFMETKVNSNPKTSIYEESVRHLTLQHVQYFKHWMKAIHLETPNNRLNKPVSDIWELKPTERESKGKTISNLMVKSIEFVNGFYRTLFITNDLHILRDFSTYGLTLRNYLIVSSLERVGIAAGFVVEITKTSLTLDLERNLNERYPGYIFAVDYYESDTRNASSYLSSLLLLMENNESADKLRKIVIEGLEPQYKKVVPKKILNMSPEIINNLNLMQQNVIYKTIATKDYLLINGMPGTGKTQTIVALVEVLNFLKKSVLITSHTHSAVDNVLEKLLKNKRIPDEEILKLGTEFRSHSVVQSRCENLLIKQYNSVEDLEKFYNAITVVGVTCLGSNHLLLDRRKFDVCIVDESTQVLQPILFKALMSAKVFVLVGDPEQLPPIVQNSKAQKLGMGESLFDRLQSSKCTESLNFQYRMNKTINDLANKLTYNGNLMCGNGQVANSTLAFSNSLDATTESWLKQLCDDKLENAVQFFDTCSTYNLNQNYFKVTDNLDTELVSDTETNVKNICETVIIVKLVKSFLQLGLGFDDIGIIAPYQLQISLLKGHVPGDIEISTVDQYQGRDKKLIIMSCTRSYGKENHVGDASILADKRRLNVAITRAKHKLILIGDRESLKSYQPFANLFTCLTTNQILHSISYADFSWDNLLKSLV